MLHAQVLKSKRCPLPQNAFAVRRAQRWRSLVPAGLAASRENPARAERLAAAPKRSTIGSAHAQGGRESRTRLATACSPAE